jgi:hypothetical protein
MMEHFRMDNTEGFDQETLDLMNVRMSELGADDLDEYDFIQGQEYKRLSEKVFNEFGF